MTTKVESVDLAALPLDAETREYDMVAEAPSREPRRPSRLGRYVVLHEIGRGGMGVVWTAYDPKLDRKVAIKLLKSTSRKSVRRARFIREAQALAKLNHPNIITVHDVGTHERRLYMAMEYVQGQTLERWAKGERHWRQVLEVFDRAGQGLAAAHAAGFTHRDFKPSNVLIAEDGRVKVLDFGLAKHFTHDAQDSEDLERFSGSVEPGDNVAMLASASQTKLTQVGRLLGTPGYMAPEQFSMIDQREMGAWTDQFSFGITLYEALYGDLPFEGVDLYEIYDNIRDGNICEPPRESPVPGWVLRVLHRALHYDPEQRFESMTAMLAALRADPVRRRRRIMAYSGGVAVLGLAMLGVVQMAMGGDDEETIRPCQSAAERLDGVWDGPARTRMEEGLVATKRPFAVDTAQRVAASLDRYADAWVKQHTTVCEATRIHGEQSEALLDVRMACLDRRRSELRALVGVLATAEEGTVAAAVVAAAELRRPEACATAQPGGELELPTDPGRRDEFLRVRGRIDEAFALLSAGRHVEARDMAAAAGVSAGEANFVGLRAQSLIAEGSALQELREPRVAQQRLREGIVLASEVGDAHTEFLGWNSLLYTAGVLLGDPQQAADWQFSAEAALRHAGSPPDLEFKLALTTSAVMVEVHRFEEAASYGEQARHIAQQDPETPSLQLAGALNNLGIVAAKQANWALAESRLRESYDLKARIFGADHPDVVSNGVNLANVLTQLARQQDDERAYDEAERLYGKALAFRENSEGERSHGMARALTMLGNLQINRGKKAEGRATMERALTILRGLESAEGDLARTLNYVGLLDRDEGDFAKAEARHREALEIQLAKYGSEHLLVGTTRQYVCTALVGLERFEDALAMCGQALMVFEQSAEGRHQTSAANVHTMLATLHDKLGQPARAARHRAAAGLDPEPIDIETPSKP